MKLALNHAQISKDETVKNLCNKRFHMEVLSLSRHALFYEDFCEIKCFYAENFIPSNRFIQ